MKRAGILLIFILLCVTTSPVAAQGTMPPQFEQWIERGMEKWEIPGLAISVVHQGEIAYMNGFGVRKLGSSDAVDQNTQFGIASVTKHMAAVSLGLLVDEGVLNWHDPVREFLPWFELSDPWATRHVTVHDLLTHQVGVGRILGNRLQYLTNRSRYELLFRMRYHEFEQPFRSAHIYNNAMYAVAGEVAGAVSGRDWDDLMHDRLFRRLQMSRTNTSIVDLDEENAAWPHQYIEGEILPIERRNWDVASAAGGVNSTAADMANWMIMQLSGGSFNGSQIISTSTLNDIQTPKVVLPVTSVDAPQQSYGYGYRITDYRGYRILAHGGATDGMNSNYVLIPQLQLGIMIMTNTFNNFMNAIPYHIIDHILGVEGPDWKQAYHNAYTNQYERALELRKEFESTRIPDTTPTHPLPFYTGRFHHDLYDALTIREDGDGLVLTLFDDPELMADLEHWHHNMFRVIWRNRALREEFIQFHLSDEGRVDQAEFRFSLQPVMLQVGAYPASSYRHVPFKRVSY